MLHMERKKRFGGWQGVPKKSLSGSGKSPVYQIVMPPELLEKCKRNGPDWVRAVLDATPNPNNVARQNPASDL